MSVVSSRVVSRVLRVVFFRERNVEKVFFNNKVFAVIMPRLYRVRITPSRVVRGWPHSLSILLDHSLDSQSGHISSSDQAQECISRFLK